MTNADEERLNDAKPTTDAENACATKDSGYAWLVCGAAFCTLFVTLGIHYSCGVVFVALLDSFGESKAKTAWVQSISQFMLFFFCPLSSVLTERYGARAVTMTGGILMSVGLLLSSFAQQLNILYITYGVIFGFGTALAYLPTLVMVGQYFEKRRSLATGIATCGSNTGALSLAIVQEVMLNKHGWRNVFRFNSGFALVVIMCGVIFRPIIPVPTRERPMVARANGFGFKKKIGLLMRNKKFILWCLATTTGTFGYFIPHVHLLRYAQDNKVSLHKATLLITYMSAGSAVGKLIYGRISDHLQSRTQSIYVISMFISGISSILFSLVSTTYTGLVVYVIVFGLLDGSFVGLMSIMTFKCTGSVELMSHSWGISLMFMSCSMIMGPPTVGWMRDANISYRCLFYLTGGPMILGALILLPTIWMKNDDSFPDNSLVLINDPALPESNSQHRIEIQRLDEGCKHLVQMSILPNRRTNDLRSSYPSTNNMDENDDSFPDNSLVLINDPALPESNSQHRIETLPESNSQHRIEIQRLTVL